MVGGKADELMTVRSVLIDTPAGPLGAAITEPAGRPVGAALVLPGGGRRTGPNRLWGRLAHAMADAGVIVGRIDLPGHGDSDLIPSDERNTAQAMRYAGLWWSDIAGDLDTMLVCGCYGSRLVGPVLEESNVAQLALIVPYLRTRYPNVKASSRRTRAARWLLRRRPSALDKKMVRSLAAHSRETPIWVLVGEHDLAARYAGAIRNSAPDPGMVTIETIDGVSIHTHSSPRSQAMTIQRVTSWAQKHIPDTDMRDKESAVR